MSTIQESECYAVWDSTRQFGYPWGSSYPLDSWGKSTLETQIKVGMFMTVGYHDTLAQLIVSRPSEVYQARAYMAKHGYTLS